MEIIEAIADINEQQKTEITTWLNNAFEAFDAEMDDKLKNIYNDLKKTSDLEVKLKLSIPLIKILGIDFGVKFDVKNWAQKTYQKHEVKIFKLMGLL